MKFKELKILPKEELERLLNEYKERLRTLRFDLSFGKVKNVRELREVKKTIARILTLLNQKKNL